MKRDRPSRQKQADSKRPVKRQRTVGTFSPTIIAGPKWTDELKYTYYDQSTTADSNGLATSVFTNITRGDGGKDQFDGSVMHPKSVTLNVQCILADSTNLMRILVVQAIRGALPTAAQLFQSVGNTRAPLSTFDRAYKSQVNILSDTLMQLSTNDNQAQVARIYIKGKKLNDVYWTTTGALALISGDISVYYISDSSAVTHPAINYAVETTYTD